VGRLADEKALQASVRQHFGDFDRWAWMLKSSLYHRCTFISDSPYKISRAV
jgi:hypothetical protein